MANIVDKTTQIRQATHGLEIRESLASGIEVINAEVENNSNRQTEVETRQTSLEKIFDAEIQNLTLQDPSSAEIVQARVKKDGTTYPVLKTRLDDIDSSLAQKSQQISDLGANKADKTEVNSLATNKAEKTEVTALDLKKADQAFVDSQFAAIVSGAPKGTYSTLSALQLAYPTGVEGIFLILSDGHWYYWNGTTLAWTDGGVYQATQIPDRSVTVEKTNFINNYNLFDKTKITPGGNYNASSLQWVAYPGISQSEFIPCVDGDIIRIRTKKISDPYHIVYKNNSGVIFTGIFPKPNTDGLVQATVPYGAVSFSAMVYDNEINTLIIVKNRDILDGFLSGNLKVTDNNFDNNSISKDKMNFKTIEDYIVDEGALINLFDKTKIRTGGNYNAETFQWVTFSGVSQSEFIPCVAGDIFKLKTNKVNNQYHIVYKNNSGVIFAGTHPLPLADGIVKITVPANVVSVSFMVYDDELNSLMIVKNREIPTSYIPYINSVDLKPALENAIVEIIDSKVTKPSMDEDEYLENRVLVWEDDFEGTSLDKTSWYCLQRSDGSGNGQLEYNTDRSKNVRVENSNLVITARKENFRGLPWTSASINTSNLHEFQYGRIEAKMKLPKAQGMWPAFWAMGAELNMFTDDFGQNYNTGLSWPECGEIDIMEFWGMATSVYSAIHWHNGTGHQSTSGGGHLVDVTNYHIYGMEWTPEKIDFMVDGVVHGTFNIEMATVDGKNPFRKPHYLLLNLAVSGDSKQPNESTPIKSSMYVDWVRVYAPVGETAYINAESISLDKSALNMAVGESKVPINATIMPSNTSEKTIKWSTSDPNVAIVGSGYVTAVGVGTCTITARTINNKIATCTVIVV
ncbi:MAG: glycosyl hydrolase family protein [Clostridium lundense]|nr:glycosyl hydrolase family protein [Clostridium lundense]